MILIISISLLFLVSRSSATNLFLYRSYSVLLLRAGGVPSNTKMGSMLFLLSSMILLRIDLIFSKLLLKLVSILTIQMEASMASIFPLSCSIEYGWAIVSSNSHNFKTPIMLKRRQKYIFPILFTQRDMLNHTVSSTCSSSTETAGILNLHNSRILSFFLARPSIRCLIFSTSAYSSRF